MGGATAAMLEARYGYGPNRGPRRMPARMANRFVTGLPEFGGEEDDEEYGVDIPDGEFDSWMASMGTAVGTLGTGMRALARHRVSKPPASSSFVHPVSNFGDVGDAAAAEMFGDSFGEDGDEEADLGDLGDEDGGEGGGGGGFHLPTLPRWALPAAIGTAAAAGAVGLGLALTSKKRKAKRAAREAEEGSPAPSFGAMGDTVAADMFGDPDDDQLYGWDFTDDQYRSMGFGEDPAVVTVTPVFGPGPSSSPTAAVLPTRPEAPTWHQYKRASRDVFRAGQEMSRAQERLAESGVARRVAEAQSRLSAADSRRQQFRAQAQLARAEGRLAGSGVQRRATEAADQLSEAQSALPSFPSFGAHVAAYGCTPSAYYGVYGAMDPITQKIGAIESQVIGIVTKFIPLIKRPVVLPQLIVLNQKRDKVIDQGASSDSPQASQIEDQAMRLLSGLDQATASTLWTLGRQRDNLRRQLAGRPTEPIRPPPMLV